MYPFKADQEEKWFQVYPLLSFMLDATQIEDLKLSGDTTKMELYLFEKIKEITKKINIPADQDDIRLFVTLYLREVDGYGPIQELMEKEAITDILINRFDEIYVEENGKLIRTTVRFSGPNHLEDFVLRLLMHSSVFLDAARPYVDFQLKDGTRVNVIGYPLVQPGPVISIRKFYYRRLHLNDLVEKKSLTKQAACFLKMAVKAHLNIVISGGTGVGKTTLLNALLEEVSDHERIMVIEDTLELAFKGKHVVRTLTKPATAHDNNGVTQRDLLKNALRMRPDRIIIGEIRGAEILEMLQAMNTGMNGSISTIHAGSIKELPMRFSNILAISELNMSPKALVNQLSETVDIVIQLKKHAVFGRYISEIAEITGEQSDTLMYQTIYESVIESGELVSRYYPNRISTKIIQKAIEQGATAAEIEELTRE